jgi:hypothetical protein
LNDRRLQAYAELIRGCDYANRVAYNLKDWLNIWWTGLGPIATKFGKVIICFETGGPNVKRELIKRSVVFLPNINHHFILVK